MTRTGHAADKDMPWSFPVLVAQVPETGLHQVLDTTAAQRERLAAVAGVNAVTQAEASFDVVPAADGRVHVTGRVRARVGQTCVVTLDPVENEIDEPIDVEFAPPSQIPASARSIQAAEEGEDGEIPDPPEPIVNGTIDLGQLAAEFLVLGIDPYPRKPGAVFVAPEVAKDPEDHPFAALKALKTPATPKGKKPRNR
jgi:uncharacterized metal-binding protein YceD (DUF177 family)